MQRRIDLYYCVFEVGNDSKFKYVDINRMLQREKDHIPRITLRELFWALAGNVPSNTLAPPPAEWLRKEILRTRARDCCTNHHDLLRQLALHYRTSSMSVATVFAFDFGRPGEAQISDLLLARQQRFHFSS